MMYERATELRHRHVGLGGKHPVQQDRLVRLRRHDVEQRVTGAATGGDGNLAFAEPDAIRFLRVQQQARSARGAAWPMTVSTVHIEVSPRTGLDLALSGVVPLRVARRARRIGGAAQQSGLLPMSQL